MRLDYDEMPDYNKLRKIFQDGLRKRKFTNDGQTVKFKTADCASFSTQAAFEDDANDMVKKSDFTLGLIQENHCNDFVTITHTNVSTTCSERKSISRIYLRCNPVTHKDFT